MKKYNILLLAIFVILINGCNLDTSSQVGSDSGIENDGSNGESGQDTPITVMTKCEVYDSNNVYLGKATAVGYGGISLLTDDGYMFTLGWDGEIAMQYLVCYTEQDCGGTPFTYGSYPFYYKTIYSGNDKFYTYRDSLDGYCLSDDSITEYSSIWQSGNLTNYATPIALPTLYKAYVFEEIDRVDIDLPTDIALPIVLQWEN